jgi:hypothetical protein
MSASWTRHAYDLRAAKSVGMRTVYIRREIEDIGDNIEQVGRDVDFFLDSLDGSVDSGLKVLAAHLAK